MGVGAIGNIGIISYNPYIYNSNSISSASLNRVNRISDDATDGGVDATSIMANSTVENINPLKKGETPNFSDILLNQMSMTALKREDLLATNSIEDAV